MTGLGPCASGGHEQVPAIVVGTFRASWWPVERAERVAFCADCAALGALVHFFTPDPS